MSTIFFLTLTQLTQRRRYAIVLLLALVPVLIAGAVTAFATLAAGELTDVHDAVTDRLLISTVLPVAALLLATATLGDEVDDQTLGYLALKPIPRWRIAVPKLAATALVIGVPVAFSGTVSSLLLSEGDIVTSLVTAVGVLVGAIVYCVAFGWAGLASRQAIAFGLGYVFLWEFSITGLFSGLRFVSIRQYALGTIQGLDGDRLQHTDASRLDLAPALIGALVVLLIFGWLTDRRLRLMDIP